MAKQITGLPSGASGDIDDSDLVVVRDVGAGQDKQVTRTNFLNDAVDTAHIMDNAVTNAKILDGAVDSGKLDTTAGELGGAWEDWTPTLSAGGSMTYTSTTIVYSRYIQIGKTVFYTIRVLGTTGGTADNGLFFSLPVTAKETSNSVPVGSGYSVGGTTSTVLTFTSNSGTEVEVRYYDSSVWSLGTGRGYSVSGNYEVA